MFFSSQDISYAGDCPNNATAPLSSTLDLQRYLDCNGFSPGPIDGSMGPQTKQAIKQNYLKIHPDHALYQE